MGRSTAPALGPAPLRTDIVQRDDEARVVEVGEHRGRDADGVESVMIVSDGRAIVTVSAVSGQEVGSRDGFNGACVPDPSPNDAPN